MHITDVLSADAIAHIKGIVAGFFFLLFSHNPETEWNMDEVIKFLRRVGIGLTLATVGTEVLQHYYDEIPTAPAAAALMAFGMEIVDRFVRPKIDSTSIKKEKGDNNG